MVSEGAAPQGEPGDPGGLGVRVTRAGRILHLQLSGELDMATSPMLREHLTAAEAGETGTILIDLAHLTFMDSSGLHTFLTAAERAGDRGRPLAFVNCPDPVRRIFELTGTERVLDGAFFGATVKR